MKLIHLISAFCFCCCALTALAQKSTSTLPFRFATKAEAQMLITDIDEYTNRWNQFDIVQDCKNRTEESLNSCGWE